MARYRVKKSDSSKCPLGIKFLLVLGCGIIFFCAASAYARFVEPGLLAVTRHEVKSSHLPKGFHDKKIVQFSDTHLGDYYSIPQLKTLVQQINQEKPDIVVFTGDLVDNFHGYSGKSETIATVLSEIKSSLGKYAVYGNHDRGGGGNRHYEKIMKDAGFTVLVNETQEITLPSKEKISISGLDDFLLGEPNIEGTLGKLKPDGFHMLLVHEPDVVDQLTSYAVDLQLSGHSHGGQVKLPGGIALVTVPLARKYIEGQYWIQGDNGPIQLYVNRGIGTTRAPLRLLSKPELSVFTLMKE
ncbi:metallophosphoesterase [Paenibacillus sp. KN14-4R]|uniref:metallophosphoesterase n=1 Tax=Paenibacillus sp. KN14-4R TaxID=3445773 RepID=UPI003FA1928A